MPDPPSIEILYRRAEGLRGRHHLLEFAETLRAQVARGRTFDCLITNDLELRRLNRKFLGHDYATDVLSFPSGSRKGSRKGWLGEMAISVGRARTQAREHCHTILDEVRILMLHGLLHLMGMDHESDGGKMRRAELKFGKKLGLPVGLIERTRP